MIYIDPPYNTGKDFVYRDNFHKSKSEYDEESTVRDEDDNKLVQNTESNGRFHSDWCSMIYPRLKLARDLLSDDGVIFISIDDNEVHNLRKICDEIFGEGNFIENLIWQKKFSRSNDATYFSSMHDHILCYVKTTDKNIGWEIGLIKRTDEIPKGYSNPDNDPRGPWTSVILSAKSGSDSLLYKITMPSGRECYPPSGRYWSCSKETFEKWLNENRIWFGKNGDGIPRKKTFLSEVQSGLRPNSILFQTEAGNNQEARQELKNIFGGEGTFDSPKPTKLIKLLFTIANIQNAIILDFFSGSATTAHACMQLNAEDGGNRKFIMVQLPEKTDEKSEAFKAGYKNICEIGKERIRRAGEKIKAEHATTAPNLDIGFRVLKVAESNMKDVYYSPAQTSQDLLDSLESNIKEDRTDLDLLFACLIDFGVELSLPLKSETIDGVSVHTVQSGEVPDIIACFAENIPEPVVREIASRQPLRAVFRDSSFKDSPSKINVKEIFKYHSPNTTIKVL